MRAARVKTAALSAAALLTFLALHPQPAAARDKTDVVTMRNGDRLTGEIKSLEYGLLTLSTDHMRTVEIEWREITGIESAVSFDVERIGGIHSFGALSTDADETLVVRGGYGAQTVPMASVTRLSEVESTFWGRVNGTATLGYNYTKSSGISVGNMSISSAYTGERLRATLDASANHTSSPDAASTDQEQIATTVQFLSNKPRFWIMLNSLESNEQLGIERRLQSGAAVARYFKQTADLELTGLGGLVVNQEWTTGVDSSQQSVEGVLGAQWRVFRFSDPEVSLASTVALYPSITESGRYRTSLNVSLQRDLIKDLTLNLTIYESYDSDPPDNASGAPVIKQDYGIVTSIGYKF